MNWSGGEVEVKRCDVKWSDQMMTSDTDIDQDLENKFFRDMCNMYFVTLKLMTLQIKQQLDGQSAGKAAIFFEEEM